MIERNAGYIGETVETLTTMDEKIEEGSSDFAKTKTAFEEIVSSMDESIGFVEQVVAEMDAPTSSLHIIGKATDEVAISAEVLNVTAQRF